jgi:nitroreductase
MNVTEAIFKRRSIRRFSPQPVDKEVLYELVQAARMAPAAANIQPLQYMIVHQKQLLDPVFDCTLWAGYLEDYAPKPGFRPMAYIVVLVNEDIKKAGNDNDAGAAVQNILLTAVEKGLGSCWIHREYEMFGTAEGKEMMQSWGLPEGLVGIAALALGYPNASPSPAKPRKEGYTRVIR